MDEGAPTARGVGAYQDGGHADGCGGRQILFGIFEKGGGPGVEGLHADNAVEGRGTGLGNEVRGFNMEDGLEQVGDVQMFQHARAMPGVGVGEDQPSAGQALQGGA